MYFDFVNSSGSNYVVQHLLSLKVPGVAESLLIQLKGRFFYLACNKYGSNVVERFLQDSGEKHSTSIVLELLHNPNVAMLLVDPYGNYVIKSALSASKVSGNIHVWAILLILILHGSCGFGSSCFW